MVFTGFQVAKLQYAGVNRTDKQAVFVNQQQITVATEGTNH